MKLLLLMLILLGGGFHVLGQVSGRFLTSTRQPVPFANVLLLRTADSTMVLATQTDEQGQYLLDRVAPGAYKLRVSSLGYQGWESPVFELSAAQPRKAFGEHLLTEDARQLGEVVVRGEKPVYQQSLEGLVVNVGSSVLSKGSSVLQILERSPGVVIDYRNGGLILNGKTGVTVLLNGKPMRMPIEQVVALLNGMSADAIEKIELLTTPGAKYDAEGSAGIINIVLKKSVKPGTNGTVSLTGGYGWGEKGSGSGTLSHTAGNVSIHASYSWLRDRTYSRMFVDSRQHMPALGGSLHVLAYDTTRALQNNHDLVIGLDGKLNAKTTLGFSVNGSQSIRKATNFNRLSYTILPSDSLLLFRGTIDGLNRWRNLVSSFYAERKNREGEVLNLNLDYLLFNNQSPTEVYGSFRNEDGSPVGTNDSLFAPRQRGFADTKIRIGVVKVDYNRKLSTKLNLEAGAKATFTKTISEAGLESLLDDHWVNRSETATALVMREGIGAVYASATAQIRPATNLVIGVRYEFSRTTMNNPETGAAVVDRKLSMLFPSVLLTRKLKRESELQVSYTKRISRPSYTDLASFVRYSDPSAVYTGNPMLKPTLTNTLKLGLTYRNASFALFVSRDENPIARYQLSEGPARNLLYVTPQNMRWQNTLNLQINLPLKPTTGWEMNYGFTGGLRQFSVDYTPKPVDKSYVGYSLTMGQTIKLPRRFTVEVSSWYNSASYNGTIRVGGMGALNAGIKKELKNNHGSLQVLVTDLLRTMRINVSYGSLTEEVFAIRNHVRIDTESRISPVFRLTYSRSFGKTVSKDMPGRRATVGDERERVQN
ncbi:TonB-dependent receptor domain-containing protein [Larkinella sp. VNQ87]|uniref:TonB-dependent receptor domain-containing protein n=1 Tax=Larkinella sp. VNQ87 TaxID=3400921 RepID=UPI003C022070